MARKIKTRRITKHDRLIDHENAMKGVAKWKRTPTGARRAERVRSRHGWGFEEKKRLNLFSGVGRKIKTFKYF